MICGHALIVVSLLVRLVRTGNRTVRKITIILSLMWHGGGRHFEFGLMAFVSRQAEACPKIPEKHRTIIKMQLKSSNEAATHNLTLPIFVDHLSSDQLAFLTYNPHPRSCSYRLFASSSLFCPALKLRGCCMRSREVVVQLQYHGPISRHGTH